MRKIFNIEGGIYKFASKILDLMYLNVLVLIFSIPIVTIGSAMSAASRVLFDQEEGEEKRVFFSFLSYFKQYLFQGIILFFLGICTILFLIIGVWFTKGSIIQFVVLLFVAFTLVYYCVSLMTLAYHKGAFEKLFSMSITLLIKYTGFFCLGVSSLIVTWTIPIFFPKVMFIWFFLGVSIPLLINVKIYFVCYGKLMNLLNYKGE